jgi:hypothetical protein
VSGGIVRSWFVCFVCLTCCAISPRSARSAGPQEKGQPSSADSELKQLFEAKIKTEWEALKNKDKKTYGNLLADDYEGVEVDGRGERNKLQSVNELSEENVANYTIWGLKLTPLSPDACFIVYEVTMQFPPRAQIRYSRVYIGELWVKRQGEWKALHYQETSVK